MRLPACRFRLLVLLLSFTAGSSFAGTIHVPGDRPTIQGAIDAASAGDIILVAPGTYLENVDFHAKAVTVKASGAAEATIIDGQQRGPVVAFISGETASSVISGFTLRNGSAGQGGGILVSTSSPVITNNIISQNTATSEGGGIGVDFGSPSILNNTISNNATTVQGLGGGGISIRGASTSHIKENIIINNSTLSQGGGVALWSGNAVTIENNVISSNTAYSNGGGISIFNDTSSVVIGQNVITGNSAINGHAVYWSNSPAMFVNNTVTDGNGVLGGSTVSGDGFSDSLKVANNIIVAIAGAEHAFRCEGQSLAGIFKNNDVLSIRDTPYDGMCGDQTGHSGNISSDPKFVAGGFQLQPGSPAIDAGSGSGVNLFSADFINNPRTVNGSGGPSAVIDMGAYEYVPTALQFVPMSPCRVVDTRGPDGLFGGPFLSGGEAREFTLPNSPDCHIPATAIAYSLNVTVVPYRSLGYLTLWPSGPTQPLVSTLNSPDGRAKANAALTLAGNDGAVRAYVTGNTHLVLDIDGYFVAGGPQTYQFYPLTPCRVIDTRNPNGPLGGPYLHGGRNDGLHRDFPVRGSDCIPANANVAAYSLNFTAAPHVHGQRLGYLTVWPEGSAQPFVSTLNNPTATVVANAAIVPAGSDGGISVFAYDDTDMIADINGYFGPAGQGGYSFYPAAPCRAYDSRNNNGQPFQGTKVVNIAGSPCAPPATARGYVFNATVVPDHGHRMGYLTLWPDGDNMPLVSTLNAYDGLVTSNMAIVPNDNGSIDAYADGLTHLILDISGYFAP
jgi:hypothetical protein